MIWRKIPNQLNSPLATPINVLSIPRSCFCCTDLANMNAIAAKPTAAEIANTDRIINAWTAFHQVGAVQQNVKTTGLIVSLRTTNIQQLNHKQCFRYNGTRTWNLFRPTITHRLNIPVVSIIFHAVIKLFYITVPFT